MARNVVIRRIANANLSGHASYLSQRVSPGFAARWLTAIHAAIAGLATEADRYPEADEAADLGMNLREQLHGRRPHVYRILFTIDGNTVNVIRVRHAAQDRLTDNDI